MLSIYIMTNLCGLEFSYITLNVFWPKIEKFFAKNEARISADLGE